MEAKDLDKAIEDLKNNLEGKTQTEVKAAIETLEGKFKTQLDSVKKETADQFQKSIDDLKKDIDAKQAHLDALDVKVKKQSNIVIGQNTKDAFKALMGENLVKEFDSIKSVRKGNGHKFEIKAVGDMTQSANLTGDSIFTYQSGAAALPGQAVNFASLVPTISSATGTYIIYRETAGEGSISAQTEGASKTQIDFDLSQITYNALYLSGYARFSKQMATDLPFLTSWLPDALRREYFKVENSTFWTALRAAATLSTTAGTTAIERVIEEIGSLEAADYMPDKILLNPADWATIANTKPSDFSLPSVVAYVNGQLVVHGLPVYKASWVPSNEYVVGEWSQAKKVLVDGLAVEFFEQDADNVTKNLITARIESRTVLAIDQPAGFRRGMLTGAHA